MPDSPEIYWRFTEALRHWINNGTCEIIWGMFRDGDKFYLETDDDVWGEIQGVLVDVADKLSYDLSF